MARCAWCGEASLLISRGLEVCGRCLGQGQDCADFGELGRAGALVVEKHVAARRRWLLPPTPPEDEGGLACAQCANSCRVGVGGQGYCGLRRNVSGHWEGVSAERGVVSWYYDDLPTNCVADWVCAGGTGTGHPRYALTPGPECGYRNLAVFFHGCTFDCLFCQNWHHRDALGAGETRSSEELAAAADDRTTCICYFGGDPSAQMPFALRASALALERARGRVLRICWETNGSMSGQHLDRAVALSLETGGTVKFDLKAWSPRLHRALTGVDNRRTLENFARASAPIAKRPDPPLLVASTLLIPGYVDEEEVTALARFIARLSPDIPYALLAFAPQFTMNDLPTTSRAHALRAAEAATAAGLTRVHVGNVHLLGSSYE